MNDSSFEINSKTYLKKKNLISSKFIKKKKILKFLIIRYRINILFLFIIIILLFIILKKNDTNYKIIGKKLILSREIIKIYSSLFNEAKNGFNKGPKILNDYIPKKLDFKEKKGIGICCIGKNENLYAKEYVEYYFKLGIKKIIIYDNNDINGEKFEDVLEEYIKNNYVEIINIRGFQSTQIPIYNLCYKTYNKQFDYISFLDFDEFIIIKKNLNINEYIYSSKLQKCETILLNWVIYGDNELEKYDNRTMMERFTKPIYKLSRGKNIVRTDIPNLIIVTSHVIGVNTNYFCDSNGKRLFPKNFYDFESPKYLEVYIKHFFTKTAEEFCMKLNRGDAHFYKEESNYLNIMNERINSFMKFNKINNEKLNIIENCSGINLNKYRYKI